MREPVRLPHRIGTYTSHYAQDRKGFQPYILTAPSTVNANRKKTIRGVDSDRSELGQVAPQYSVAIN
jgi:hypothetical protein